MRIVFDKDARKLRVTKFVDRNLDAVLEDCDDVLAVSKNLFQLILFQALNKFIIFLTFPAYIFGRYIISWIKFTCARTFIIVK